MKSGPALIVAALLWLILAAAAYFFPFLFIFWLYAGLALVPFAAIDLLILVLFTDKLEVQRELRESLSQGRPVKVKLTLSRSRKKGKAEISLVPSKIRLYDLHPLSMEAACFPTVIDRKLFEKSGSISFEYTVIPRERGIWLFTGCELLLSSPLRFWQRKIFHKCQSAGRTFPDFKKIRAAADLRFLLERTGAKNIRRRGQGMEFQNLRDYHEGDSLKDIDWRAVSRRRNIDNSPKLTVREYQEEQDQQLLFLLDTGYRLHKKEIVNSAGIMQNTRTQFDSALESVLLLSWISLKHGDSVAAASFGTSSRWIFPRKGMSAFPLLMNGLFDLASSPAPSSPFSCLEESLDRLKRRTFIILISNFREEDGLSLSWILKRIERRHLLLLVSLQEKDSEALASRQPKTEDEALETAAAFSYLNSRKELYKSWEHSGLLTLEASTQTLSPALITRYLQVKRSGRL